MDSLKIQDVFEPYYAGRKRFAAPKDSVPSEKGNRQSQKIQDADQREPHQRDHRRVLL